MSYAIYLRKSRKDSELESRGIDVLERHEKTLLEYAGTRNLPIGGIYREVVSGDSIDARPQMKRLLSEVEAGIWEGVLVMEVERLARGDTIDQGRVQRAFFYSSTLIVTPAKTYDPRNEFDNEYFEFNLFMSRREYAAIKRRMQNGRVRSVKDGYYVGNTAPYGWKRIRAKDGKHYTLAPHPEEAPILKLMYDFIGNKKYGFQKTASELQKAGIVSRSGKPFTPSTIKGIISNPVNIGKVRWNYRAVRTRVVNGSVQKTRPKSTDYILADAEHDGIISDELYRRANAPASSMSSPARRDRPIQNPFAGILYCAKCGRIMVRKKGSGRAPRDYLICPYAGCETVGIRSDELEQVLIEWLQDYIRNCDTAALPSGTDEISHKQAILSSLEDRHETLRQQRDSLFDLLEQGIYTQEVFLSRSGDLSRRIDSCLLDIQNARSDLAKTVSLKNEKEALAPKCRNLLEIWPQLDAAGKNDVLKNLIDKIYLTKTQRNSRQRHDCACYLDVYPKIPRQPDISPN